jgi:hypothetical protein
VKSISPPPAAPGGTLQRVLAGVFTAVLATVVALSGFVLVAMALLVGMATFAGLYLWTRLRGRDVPPVSFAFRRGTMPFGRQPGASPPARGEVVDVEAVEVPDRAGGPR